MIQFHFSQGMTDSTSFTKNGIFKMKKMQNVLFELSVF